MLSNAYFLALFRFDTTENEPAKNLQKLCRILQIFEKFANFVLSALGKKRVPRLGPPEPPAPRRPGRFSEIIRSLGRMCKKMVLNFANVCFPEFFPRSSKSSKMCVVQRPHPSLILR